MEKPVDKDASPELVGAPITHSPGRILSAAARMGVTPRALAITAILTPFNAWWLYEMQEVWYVGNPTILSLYFNVVFILCILVVANLILRRVAPRWAFSQAELLVIYTLLSITTSCAAYDFIHWFVPDIAGVAYRATPENRWKEIFFQYLPQDMTMRDPQSLKLLYEGGVGPLGFYKHPDAWQPWVRPLGWWLAMLIMMWLAPLGLAVLFRRRWVEVERLTFPIVQLPFEMTRERSRIFVDSSFWVVLGIVCLINFTNGMKVLKPAWPAFPVKVAWDPGGAKAFDISQAFTMRPWNAADRISLAFYPIIIGLGLLLPTELAISCVVFFFVFKGQQVGVSWLGIQGKPEFPFLKEQSLGGYLGILIFALWIGRAYYADMARRVLHKDPERDAGEPTSYRFATILFVVCFVGVVLISMSAGPAGMKLGTGMNWWQAIFHWAIYYVLTLVCGRIRAEMGLPAHEIERLGPLVLLGNTFGVMRGGKVSESAVRSLTACSIFFGITRGMRSIAFPHQVEGLQLMGRCGGDQKRLFKAMFAVVVFGMIAAWLVYLPTVYHYGAGTGKMKQYSDWHTYETYGQLVGWIEDPHGLAWHRVIPTGIGLLFYLTCMTLKMRVGWWPLHPIGFALSTTWYMTYWWCPFLVAWIAKTLVSRYAGHAGTRKLVPIAFGLILGDIMSGCGWTIYGALVQKEVYAFWS